MKKILFTLTVLLLVVAFGVSAFMVGNYLLEGKRQEDQMKDLANQISQAQSEAADEVLVTAPVRVTEPKETKDPNAMLPGYDVLYQQNSDAVGWIKIEGTKLNEAVFQTPDDFVIATGEQHTVRDFTEKAFAANGRTIRWEGTGIDEKGYDAATGKMLVCVNPQWFRPTDVDNLWGDPTKAKTVLGWNPQSTTYEQLVEIMAKHDRERAKREKALKNI